MILALGGGARRSRALLLSESEAKLGYRRPSLLRGEGLERCLGSSKNMLLLSKTQVQFPARMW